ncbi:MAG: sulfatase-like hydrolase/transferase [Halanaerobiaceae bacterium]
MTRPNILLIMSDEHNTQISGAYGHPFVKTPAMDELAEEGVVVEDFYCNSPLCVPSRMSFMTGRYASEIEAYDNRSPLSSGHPTLAHYLNIAGYETVLSGKMHFIGPDQRHGFQKRPVADIHGQGSYHPVPDWRDRENYSKSARKRITGAGKPYDREFSGNYFQGAETKRSAHHISYDKKVFANAADYLRDYAVSGRESPFFLTAGFFAPHFPLACEKKYWDLYWPGLADLPKNPEPPPHPMYKRFRHYFDLEEPFSEEEIRRCRAAYYGLVTFLDDHIGGLMDVLSETGLDENTVVIYTSDHGEMLGERGLWWKNSFLDHATRVPLIIKWPGALPVGERRDAVASLVDLTATILDIAEFEKPDHIAGDSMLNLLQQGADGWKDTAFIEYLAHGTDRPQCSLRRGRYKLNYVVGEDNELYDLQADPEELNDLTQREGYEEVERELRQEIENNWQGCKLYKDVLKSQKLRRHTVAGDG